MISYRTPFDTSVVLLYSTKMKYYTEKIAFEIIFGKGSAGFSKDRAMRSLMELLACSLQEFLTLMLLVANFASGN